MKTNASIYKSLWWTILVTGSIPLLFSESSFDLQWHDTYFVIAGIHLSIVLSLFLVVLASIYWLLRDYHLIHILTIFHVFVTISSIIGIDILTILQSLWLENDIQFYFKLNRIGIILLVILLTTQIFLFINIIVGLIRGKV